VAVDEFLFYVVGVEDGAFVDLAAQAPGGGEVDEDRMAGGAGGVEGGWGVRLPYEGVDCGFAQGQDEGGDDQDDGCDS